MPIRNARVKTYPIQCLLYSGKNIEEIKAFAADCEVIDKEDYLIILQKPRRVVLRKNEYLVLYLGFFDSYDKKSFEHKHEFF